MQHSVKAQKQAKDYKFVMNARRHPRVFPRIRQWLLPHFTFLLEAAKCLLKTPLLVLNANLVLFPLFISQECVVN